MFVSVKVKVRTDGTGRSLEIPGLLTPAGLLTPLLDYCIAKQHERSLSWSRKVVRSVRIFLEYMHANQQERDTYLLFQNFAQKLYSGTFDLTTRYDPSGLYWAPRTRSDADAIITNLSLFFDWQRENSPNVAKINPLVKASRFDVLWNEASRNYRRNNALLGHLWSKHDSATGLVRKVRGKHSVQVMPEEPPSFPENRFMDLISDGFRVGKRVDHRGILITLLLHGAGFRESEPFHLYVDDVIQDPGNHLSALVQIHHPCEGAAPDSWTDPTGRLKRGTRAAYLAECFGLMPRTEYFDSRHAGWKGGILDAKYFMRAHWFQPEYGELFLAHWLKYLAQLAEIDRNHPFAFANLAREPIGEMYKLSLFNDAHAAACRRIGLTVRKDLGTTPHGHRHAYGQRLKRGSIDVNFIKLFMHHASLESQRVYTQATLAEVSEALREGNARLNVSVANKQVSFTTDRQ